MAELQQQINEAHAAYKVITKKIGDTKEAISKLTDAKDSIHDAISSLRHQDNESLDAPLWIACNNIDAEIKIKTSHLNDLQEEFSKRPNPELLRRRYAENLRLNRVAQINEFCKYRVVNIVFSTDDKATVYLEKSNMIEIEFEPDNATFKKVILLKATVIDTKGDNHEW